ncbi:unnamed protein product [Rhodiola kirilowii]
MAPTLPKVIRSWCLEPPQPPFLCLELCTLADFMKTRRWKLQGREELSWSSSLIFKATFLRFLPLRSISRCWGYLSSVEIPLWMRPHVYKAWARAFHSNLEEASLPMEHYASLRDFFIRSLKEGSRPVDPDPKCLVSPVDGNCSSIWRDQRSRSYD